ncbi:MAG: hypothetical protein R3F20_01315 [Planctomycetota bacterium]
MKIYFCDECNESIPLQDIKANKITIDGGKIYCQECAPKPVKVAPVGMRTWMVVAGMMLCLAMGMGIMAVWGDQLMRRGERQTMEQRVGDLESRLAGLDGDLGSRLGIIESDLVENPAPGGSVGKLARVVQAVDENAGAVRQLRNSMEAGIKEIRGEMTENAKALAAMRERFEAEFGRLDRALSENLVEDLQRLHSDQEGIADRLRLLEGRIGNVEALSSGLLRRSAETETAAAPDKGTPLSPEVEKTLDAKIEQLKSDKANERYAAAIWFMEVDPPIRTRKGEQALVDTLEDPSDYVVTAAIASLAEMGATWTIPHVIEKLKSENEFILDGAIEALEKLTGKNDLGIESGSDRGAILAKIRELQTWWRENRAKLEGA